MMCCECYCWQRQQINWVVFSAINVYSLRGNLHDYKKTMKTGCYFLRRSKRKKQQKPMWQGRCFVRVDILLMISSSCFFYAWMWNKPEETLSLSFCSSWGLICVHERPLSADKWTCERVPHSFIISKNRIHCLLEILALFVPLSLSYLILYSLVFLLLLRLLFDRPQLSNKLATSNKLLLFFVLY